MSGLCQYSNILGEPGKGVHAIRVGNIAIVDVLLTVIAAFAISKLLDQSFWFVLIILLILAIILHRTFCVRTTIDKLIFN